MWARYKHVVVIVREDEFRGFNKARKYRKTLNLALFCIGEYPIFRQENDQI